MSRPTITISIKPDGNLEMKADDGNGQPIPHSSLLQMLDGISEQVRMMWAVQVMKNQQLVQPADASALSKLKPPV